MNEEFRKKDEKIGIIVNIVVFIILIIMAITPYIREKMEKKVYECITLDGEKIICDKVDGTIVTKDGTSYVVKEFKRVEKEK